MNLPEVSLINFFNKVLISLAVLTKDESVCNRAMLVELCQQNLTGGERADYIFIIDHCKFCGLIQQRDNSLKLTTLGHKFLAANRERYFEITPAQKQILAERIVFKGAWTHHARGLFDNFYLNQNDESYEWHFDDSTITKSEVAAVYFFKILGILTQQGNHVIVNRVYTELVYQLTADRKAISEQQLEKILMENRKIGAQAENAIVEFEKVRLLKLGRRLQAGLVKRISTINTAAGYDIESFDGIDENEISPSRFIEVKATTSDQIRFYWTQNEKRVAGIKKNSYWIYIIREFKEDKTKEILPIMIQNPEVCIPKHDCLAMETHTFLIEEISEVGLENRALEEMKWYILP